MLETDGNSFVSIVSIDWESHANDHLMVGELV